MINRHFIWYPLLLIVFLTTVEMKKFKVLIGNPNVPSIAYELLSEKCDIVTVADYGRALLLDKIKGIDALFCDSNTKVDKELLDTAGPQLKVIGTMSAGYNHVDTNELKSRDIKLGNTPKVLNDAVADIAMLLAMAASRRLTEGRRHIEQNTWPTNWNPQWMLGQDISGSTIGIIGLGNIGQTIARRLKGFDVGKILYTGHREKPEGKELGAEFVNLDTLNKQSDFIFVSAPLTNETNQMCNTDFFSKMKKTGVFINTSRGQLVDQEALIHALKSGEIFAAGLDVMTPEPLPSDSELLKLPNVVLTPHIGSGTLNARNAMAQLTAQNILRGLGGEEMLSPVSL